MDVAALTSGAAAVGAAERSIVPMAGVDREYASMRGALVAAATRVLESGRFILDREVHAFEEEVGEYLGGVHAVGCANGTDALVLALRSLGVGAGDEVIVPAFTFIATAEAVVQAGAIPVFADIEPDTLTMAPRSVEGLIGRRTRAMVAVHLFGQCANMEPLMAAAQRLSLLVVEDAAQAIGARRWGKPAGGLGHVAAFSFHPTKNLGAPGDGGMVTTSDETVAAKVRELRVHGSRAGNVHESVGYNSRLDEIHAAVLRAKLPHLDGWSERRRAIAARYRTAIHGSRALVAPTEAEGSHHVYHHFTVRTDRRAEVVARLKADGIDSAIYYPRPIHEQPAYAQWRRGSLPEAERAAEEVLSIPVHPWLSPAEVERVATALANLA